MQDRKPNFRIMGKTGIGEDGKHYFQLSMWNPEGTTQIGEPFGPYGPFETLEICQKEMQIAADIAISGTGAEATVNMKTDETKILKADK